MKLKGTSQDKPYSGAFLVGQRVSYQAPGTHRAQSKSVTVLALPTAGLPNYLVQLPCGGHAEADWFSLR